MRIARRISKDEHAYSGYGPVSGPSIAQIGRIMEEGKKERAAQEEHEIRSMLKTEITNLSGKSVLIKRDRITLLMNKDPRLGKALLDFCQKKPDF